MKAKYLGICLVLVLAVCSLSQAATKVLEWKFDGNLADTSGNGFNGDPCGTPVYDTGISGQAFVSDGNQCVYKAGINTSILPVLATDTWSVNVWVYAPAQPLNWRLAWRMGVKPYFGGSGYQRCVYSSATGKIVFADLSSNYITTFEPWDIGQWQMVTTTFDGTDVRLYKNGILLAKKTYDSFENAAGEVGIPSNYGSSSYPTVFAGKFDEFTIWRGALTQQEIIDLIPPGALSEMGPVFEVAHYTMDDPNGSTMILPDHSGKGRDGVLSGFTTPIANWIAPGQKGASLAFDTNSTHTNMKVTLPAATVVSQGAQYSVAFWVKSGWQPYNSAFYDEKGSDGSEFVIRGDSGSTGAMKVYSKDAWWSMEFIMNYDASAYLSGSKWHHLAVTVDGNSAKAKWYMDGELVKDANIAGTIGLKKYSMTNYIGYNKDAGGYLSAWDRTYVDDVHLFRGVLSQEDIQAIMDEGNLDNDFDVDFDDLAIIANEWLAPSVVGPNLPVDDMEGSLTNWAASDGSGTYTGTGTISSTTNAYAGSKSLQWDYNLPARTGGNYTSIGYSFGTDRNLTGYDLMKLHLYRHAGNTSEDLLFLRFLDSSLVTKAEVRIYGPNNSVVTPVDEWDEWYVDLNRQMYQGTAYVDKTVLTNIRYIQIACGGAKETARTGRIDIDEIKIFQLPVCSPYLAGDLNYDCMVNFKDFAIFADGWMFGVQ
jgi:hypothetical protein